MEVIFKEQSSECFFLRWQEYVINNLVSYKYLPLYLEYMLYYSDCLFADKSFVIVENNKTVAICFLPIETYEGNNCISLAKSYTIAPLCNEKRLEKSVLSIIDKIAYEFKVKKIKFFLDPLVIEYKNKFNTLVSGGYIDSSSTDCLLDIRESETVLWKNLRKSYKSLINGLLKNDDYKVVVFDKENRSYEAHEKYRELHSKCAGRVTRSKETFDKQYELLENDCASLIGLKYKGLFIGFNYFFHYQNTVVYASGADDPDYEDSNIAIYHVMLWIAALYYKKRGFEFIQYSQPCGYNVVNGFDDYLDKKQINISHFKRGMGTTMVPVFRGIKYFSKELFLEDIEIFRMMVMNDFEE